MMLIFLTFGMLVFLHDSVMVSISLEGNLTWFLKEEDNPILFVAGEEGLKKPIPFYRRNGKKDEFFTFSVNQIGRLAVLESSFCGHLLGYASFVREASLS
jgi:hypothetical protein